MYTVYLCTCFFSVKRVFSDLYTSSVLIRKTSKKTKKTGLQINLIVIMSLLQYSILNSYNFYIGRNVNLNISSYADILFEVLDGASKVVSLQGITFLKDVVLPDILGYN